MSVPVVVNGVEVGKFVRADSIRVGDIIGQPSIVVGGTTYQGQSFAVTGLRDASSWDTFWLERSWAMWRPYAQKDQPFFLYTTKDPATAMAVVLPNYELWADNINQANALRRAGQF